MSENIKDARLKFSSGSVTVLWIKTNYEEERVKLTNTQLSKLKSSTKNKTGTTLRRTMEAFPDENLLHELF